MRPVEGGREIRRLEPLPRVPWLHVERRECDVRREDAGPACDGGREGLTGHGGPGIELQGPRHLVKRELRLTSAVQRTREPGTVDRLVGASAHRAPPHALSAAERSPSTDVVFHHPLADIGVGSRHLRQLLVEIDEVLDRLAGEALDTATGGELVVRESQLLQRRPTGAPLLHFEAEGPSIDRVTQHVSRSARRAPRAAAQRDRLLAALLSHAMLPALHLPMRQRELRLGKRRIQSQRALPHHRRVMEVPSF